MNQHEAKLLVDKYLQGIASPEEQKLIENWYQKMSEERKLSDDDNFEHLAQELWSGTLSRANVTEQKKPRRLWPYISAAASVILCILAGIYYFPVKPPVTTPTVTAAQTNPADILPGGNMAVLTLGNGKQLSLTEEQNGTIANESNAVIRKTADGQLQYDAVAESESITYNTLTTPRGGQYAIVLTDGTSVTLNAASSLKFPTNFTGSSREVELTGEGYFEVAHNTSKPFRVISNGQVIEVLGTHFNVNCYDDESLVRTTLVEGSVRVITGSRQVVLKPGQQAQLATSNAEGLIKVAAVNTDESVAWKNGLFEFNNASITEVMRSAARWYDVTVSYPGKIPDIRISGKMSRSVSFSGLIELLEFQRINFSIKDKKVEIID